jgi:uncharacterized membrane protein
LGKDYHSLLLRRAITKIDTIRPEFLVLKRLPNWMNCEHIDIIQEYIFLLNSSSTYTILAHEGIALVDQFHNDIDVFLCIFYPANNSKK